MSGALPDRVPVMCQMSIGHMLLRTGIPPSRFWHSAPDFVEGLLALRARYAFDGILVSLHGHAPDWERRIAGFERHLDGERIRWKSGDSTFFPGDDLPVFRPARARRPAGFFERSIPRPCRRASATSPFRKDCDSPWTRNTSTTPSSRSPAGRAATSPSTAR